MQTYQYKAIDEKGVLKKGSIEASNPFDMEQRLVAIDYQLISYQQKKIRIRAKKVSRRDLISFVIHLEQLTTAGIPIITGLKDLRDTLEHGQMKNISSALVDNIEGGKSLSEALADYPQVFSSTFVSLIKVGESTGRLDTILHDLAETLKSIDELIAQTKKIMIYPAVVGTVIFAVVSFLMIYLVPQLIPFIEEMGGEIPAHTRLLIVVSDFFINYWYVIIITPIVITFITRYLYKTNQQFHYQVDKLVLKIWLIGPLLLKVKLARVTNYLSLMYAAGISILDAIEICESLVDNLVLEEALQRVRIQLNEGVSISTSFSNVAIFPPLVLRMLSAGEMSGSLDKALDNVTYFYNREVRESIDKLEPALQPILTVVMGSIIAWIMMSVLGPVYDAISTIGL